MKPILPACRIQIDQSLTVYSMGRMERKESTNMGCKPASGQIDVSN